MTSSDTNELALARFEIEQYELHCATYEVEARSAAEAIQKLFNGDGNPHCGSEFIDACKEVGIAVADAPNLVDELRKRGVELANSIIPSIRAVRRIEADAEPRPHLQRFVS